MSKLSSIRFAVGFATSAALLPAFAADQANPVAIPNFSTFDFGWVKAGTGFLPPVSGPGPMTFDKSNPVIRTAPNARGEAVTAPLHVADLTNPLLKPWVVERMKKDNDEVIAGKIRYTARSNCRPGGVPQFLIYGGNEHAGPACLHECAALAAA